jgi:hypothetical protein
MEFEPKSQIRRRLKNAPRRPRPESAKSAIHVAHAGDFSPPDDRKQFLDQMAGQPILVPIVEVARRAHGERRDDVERVSVQPASNPQTLCLRAHAEPVARARLDRRGTVHRKTLHGMEGRFSQRPRRCRPKRLGPRFWHFAKRLLNAQVSHPSPHARREFGRRRWRGDGVRMAVHKPREDYFSPRIHHRRRA